jgi:tetratricopeptide (TPR) repeat protein
MQHRSSLRRSIILAVSLLSGCAAGNAKPDISADGAPPPPHAAVAGNAAAYLTGRFAAMENDLPYAAKQLGALLAKEPDNPELRQQAFMSSLLAGQPDAVRLAALQPADNQAAVLLLANADVKAGRWAEAVKRFSSLQHQGMMQVLQPMLIAWAQEGQGNSEAALATLQPLVEGQRFRAAYAQHAALIADLANRTTDAGRLYRLAQTEYGSINLQFGRQLASWQARAGNKADAAKTLAQAVENSPDIAIALPALQAAVAQKQVRSAADGIAEAYVALAAALRAQESSELSVVLLDLALDVRPDMTAARLLLADIYDSRGHANAALAVLAPVAPNDPLDALVRLRQAALTDRAGHSAAALDLLAQIARDYPTRPDPVALQGDVLRVQRRFPEAVKAYDKAITLVGTPVPANWLLFYDRGVALERSHQWPRAEADFLKALELSPDQPIVLNYLGYSWAQQGHNLARARQMIERAAEQRPNDGAILDSLGWVVLRQGNVPGAVKFLERAVELDSEDAEINGHLGDAYWAAGRKDEAQVQWRRALNLNPDPEEAARLRAKLHDGDQALAPPAAVADKATQ